MLRFFTVIVLFAVTLSLSAFAQDNTDNQRTERLDNKRLGGAPGTLELELGGHIEEVIIHQWSPDGTKILTADSRGNVCIWSTKTGEKLLKIQKKGYSIFLEAKWSPNGEEIVTSEYFGLVNIWSAINGELKFTLNSQSGEALMVNWSPDGTKIVGAGKDSLLKVWDVATGKKLIECKSIASISAVQWSPDGNTITTAQNSDFFHVCSITLWSLASGTEIKTLRINYTDNVKITDLQWSPDGAKIIAGCSSGKCYVWNPAAKTLKTLEAHGKEVTSVNWSPDGSKIVTSGNDLRVVIWDTISYSIIHNLRPYAPEWSIASGARMEYAFWSPDGSKIAISGGSNAGFIFNAITGKFTDTLRSGSTVTRGNIGNTLAQLRWSPEGKYISVLRGNSVNFLTIQKADKPLDSSLITIACHRLEVNTVAWSPDGLKVASAGKDGAIIIWNAKLGTCKHILMLSNNKSEVYTGYTSILWNSNSSKIICVIPGKPASVWDAITGQYLYSIGPVVNTAIWSQDGNRIITIGSNNYDFLVYDAISGNNITYIVQNSGLVLKRNVLSPDGLKLPSLSNTNSFHIINMIDYSREKYCTGHTYYLSAISWNQDGSQFASSSWDSTVKIWNMTLPDPLLSFKTETGIIDSKWSPTQDLIATLQYENYLHAHLVVWSTSTGKRLFSISDFNDNILDFRWSPDGKMIATIGYDSTASIWLASTGTKLFTTVGHTGFVRDVQWSPDSKHVATASDDHSVKIWATVEFTAVKEEAERIPPSNTFTIYPNPASDQFTIHFDQATRMESTLRLMNMLGQMVAEIVLPTGSTEFNFDTKSLLPGMYIAQYKSSVQSFIKQ